MVLGRSEFPPDFNLFNKAIFLMAYELLAYSIAILVFHKIFFKIDIKKISILKK